MSLKQKHSVAAWSPGKGITSDTEVWQKGHRFGKPANEASAREMLEALSGTTHQVISGLTLVTVDNGTPQLTTETSVVTVPFLNAVGTCFIKGLIVFDVKVDRPIRDF